jgi:hypothetical protein
MSPITETPNTEVAKYLPDELYRSAKHIGGIEGDTLFLVSDPEKRWFSMDETSCTFNLEMIRQSKFKVLCVVTPTGGVLFTTKWFLLDNGKILDSGHKESERQISLTKGEFGWDKAFKFGMDMSQCEAYWLFNHGEHFCGDEHFNMIKGGCVELDKVLVVLGGCPVGKQECPALRLS